ncbi:hypothetical protein DOTSEDRAFT_35547 [Dothistroma septosporum NZE10]|uniref:Uncharacterized protein n=1 Tax=Dothistroma septosporum (strain NZE10 / CBS 128990) TaxID=675120 RepID=M2XL88_DOTSN|nr:hypothetical protein DOTSEDRAFT_35547 [Dothistroma septosporum NZE10]
MYYKCTHADLRAADDDSKPSGSAISQHIAKLKKGSGPNSGLGAASKGTQIKSTPPAKRAALPKTPSSSAKRARTSRMSDEDDSDDENILSFAAIGKRETPARRSSGLRKSYCDKSAEEEEDDGAETCEETATGQAAAASALGSSASDNIEVAAAQAAPRDSVQADDVDDLFGRPRKESTARSKSNPPKFDYFNNAAESDEDTFAPMV